jgi:hypothetical protein
VSAKNEKGTTVDSSPPGFPGPFSRVIAAASGTPASSCSGARYSASGVNRRDHRGCMRKSGLATRGRDNCRLCSPRQFRGGLPSSGVRVPGVAVLVSPAMMATALAHSGPRGWAVGGGSAPAGTNFRPLLFGSRR